MEVAAASEDGSTAAQTFTITINDANESRDTSSNGDWSAAVCSSDHVAIGTTVGVTAFASDADATTNAVSYAITGGTGAALFAIGATSGVVTTAEIGRASCRGGR